MDWQDRFRMLLKQWNDDKIKSSFYFDFFM
jgi:hypothetical protein